MAKYSEDELAAVLREMGCEEEGDGSITSKVWITPSGYVFTLPRAVNGWLDADVVDIILADRWLPKPLGKPTRY